VSLLIFAVVFGIVPFGVTERVLAAFGLSGVGLDSVTQENFSAVQRLAFWQAGFNMFQSNPVLGVGIGNYIEAYPTYAPQGWDMVLGHAHDYYLNAAAETGLVGLAGYVALLVVAFRQVAAAVRGAPAGAWFGVALGILGSLTAISVHNVVDNMYVHGIPVLLGLLLGCSAVIPSFKHSRDPVTAGV
jgi:putative inorganic carbon (HCO3(-)) transporter